MALYLLTSLPLPHSSIIAAKEESSCYDLAPGGGDYNVEHDTPTQLINLSPWANAIRKRIGVPEAGTAKQKAACATLLSLLRCVGYHGLSRLARHLSVSR